MKTKAKVSLASKYLNMEVLLFGSLVIASGLMAVNEFRTTYRFSDLMYVNPTLTKIDARNRDMIDRLAAGADDVISAKVCRSDVVRAGMSAVMKDLDMQDSVNGYDQWAASMSRAERYVRYALTCNPANGDTWVRLALVSQAIGENPRQLADFMSQSVLLAPSELAAIQARFVVWKKASADTLSLSAKSVERDLRTLLNYGNPNDIIDTIGIQNADLQTYSLFRPETALSPYVISAATLMPWERRSYLQSKKITLPPLAQ